MLTFILLKKLPQLSIILTGGDLFNSWQLID